MHILVGSAILAGLVAFAFGERAARAFIGAMLGLGAVLVLGVVFIAVVDINRPAQLAHVHYGSAQ